MAQECPVHGHVFADLQDMKKKQGERPCGDHGATIKALQATDVEIKKDNDDQWTAINQLRKTVWGWAPLMSFLGSAIGAVLVSYFVKK